MEKPLKINKKSLKSMDNSMSQLNINLNHNTDLLLQLMQKLLNTLSLEAMMLKVIDTYLIDHLFFKKDMYFCV